MPASLLDTDGYKFSMAEAGWPLRRETFFYTHRRGGPQVMPLDADALVRGLLPEPCAEDYAFLLSQGFEMGAGFKAAIRSSETLTVRAIPRGAVFYGGEPVFSVTGPSALVSWLEPLLLQLHYRIQVATLARFAPHQLPAAVGTVTCEAQRDLVRETLDAMAVPAPPMAIDGGGYAQRVRETASALVKVVGGAGHRLFEVGLRSASCRAQHLLALAEVKAAGITRTSFVGGARALGMTAVGTMGHEHIQRFGSDAAAFRAMRDRRPARSSYLLDTFHTLRSGLPAAFDLMAEEPERGDSIRFDSGDKAAQVRVAVTMARQRGLTPTLVLEDALDVPLTRELERVREELGWPADRWFYGYGGFLVATPAGSPLTRDRVAAVYKLSQSGPHPAMKFGDESGTGKESQPGVPVVFRRVAGTGPIGLVGQEGEAPPPGYVALTGAPDDVAAPEPEGTVARSPRTLALAEALREQRARSLR
jgi:nicotinate phosphoribosyltransferase